MKNDSLSEAVEIQRDYYARTAHRYDQVHVDGHDEHAFALSFLAGCLEFLNINSVLDVGSGTGRAIRHLKRLRPDLKIVGIEPVAALREEGYKRGLSTHELMDGNAMQLNFANGAFDLCCEFGVLHHVRSPSSVIDEMLRVSNRAIFISDSNNFGQGSPASRWVKQTVNALGLWPAFNFVKTGGKGYSISEGDGLGYSYSVYNNFQQIARLCNIHVLNTFPSGVNPYRTCSHVALLGIKKAARLAD